jgi:hypothetical protein
MAQLICTGLRKVPGRCPFSELRHVSHVRSKAASKRERPWYQACSTCLTEYGILVRHDAASPGFRRASGRMRSTDNAAMPQDVGVQLVRPDRRAADGGDGSVQADQALDGVSTQASSGAGGEQRLAGQPGAFGHPDAQYRLGGCGQRDAPMFAAFGAP